eukprot:symbB.v1.2.040947.t2/scaffold7677.1/size9936/1
MQTAEHRTAFPNRFERLRRSRPKRCRGLAYALELVCHAGRTEAVGQLAANAVAFLSYPWVAPVAPEKITYEIPCHWCGTMKLEGEHFSKMGFEYCSPRCIAKHRQ